MKRWQEYLEAPLTALLASLPPVTEDLSEWDAGRKLAIGIERLFRGEVSLQWAGWPHGSTTDGLSAHLCFRSSPDSLEVVGMLWLDFDGDTFPFRAVLTRTDSLSVVIYVGQVDGSGQLPRLRNAVIIAARDKRGKPIPEIIVGRHQERLVWTKAFEWHAPALDQLLTRPDWPNIRCVIGTARGVPDLVRRLIASQSDAQAEAIYWQLDNSIVVQGSLFEAAEHVVAPLIAALAAGALHAAARHRVVELLCEIALADADPSEVELGNLDLTDHCREEMRYGLSIFHDLVGDADPRVRAAALYITHAIDLSAERARSLAQSRAEDEAEIVRKAAAHILRQ